ncbi:hypothetical protein [Aequorivita sp. Q41]|uniref:hypothetical protein n=1 Tax=Aequorivita sp. Q41 TaxID=3153300 RepID=UPI0032422EB2
MNPFLKKITVFISLFYLAIFLSFTTSNCVIFKSVDFTLDPKINKIIIGNSQPQCAYNDSLINNFKNLAKSGETYFYNYYKLKALIRQNTQLDTVFIEFSNTNILEREDQKIWETTYLNHFFPNYSYMLNLEDYYLLFLKNPVGFQKAIFKTIQENTSRIRKSNYNYKDSIGGYWHLKRQKVKAILDSTTHKTITNKKLSTIKLSQYDLVYLEKIIKLCQNNNITPFLIRSPYHPKFQVDQYELDYQKLLNERFNTVTFFDFKKFSLEDHEYADLQHLNYKGAAKYSLYFNELFSNNKKL